MLRCALFVFCLVILIAQTFASTVATKLSVVGKVFDTAGFAMGQVSVVLDSGDFRTVSRADGSFTFHNVPSGKQYSFREHLIIMGFTIIIIIFVHYHRYLCSRRVFDTISFSFHEDNGCQ